MSSVLIEGKLHLEVKTTLGRKWVERYVRLLPGSIGYWSTASRPGPGTPPRQLFLLDDLDFKVEGTSLCLIEATSGLILRLRGSNREETKKWISLVRTQKTYTTTAPTRTPKRTTRHNHTPRANKSKEKSRRSASVPPPCAEKVKLHKATDDLMLSAAKDWDNFIAKQAQAAALRDLQDIDQDQAADLDKNEENDQAIEAFTLEEDEKNKEEDSIEPPAVFGEHIYEVCTKHDHSSASLADIDDSGDYGDLKDIDDQESLVDGAKGDEHEPQALVHDQKTTESDQEDSCDELPADVAQAALKLVEEKQHSSIPISLQTQQSSAFSAEKEKIPQSAPAAAVDQLQEKSLDSAEAALPNNIQQEKEIDISLLPAGTPRMNNRPKSQRAKKKALSFSRQELGFALELVRFETGNKLIVPRIRETCEHGNILCPGDELVAVNGAAVPARFPKEAFEPLLERLSAAPRPIRLAFRETMYTIHPKDSIEKKGSNAQQTQRLQQDNDEQQIPLTKIHPDDDAKSTAIAQNQKKGARRDDFQKAKSMPDDTNLRHAGTPGNHRQRNLRKFVPMVSADEATTNTSEKKNDYFYELAFTQPKLGIVLAREPKLGGAVVSKVRETCEHKTVLRARDELISVDGVPVPQRLTDKHFEGLLKIIKASRRPLTLKLKRPSRPSARAADALSVTDSPLAKNTKEIPKRKQIQQQEINSAPRQLEPAVQSKEGPDTEESNPSDTSFFFSAKDYESTPGPQRSRPGPEDTNDAGEPPQDSDDGGEASFFFSAKDYEHLQKNDETKIQSKKIETADDCPEAYLDQIDVPAQRARHQNSSTHYEDSHPSNQASPNITTAPAPVFFDDDDHGQPPSEHNASEPSAPKIALVNTPPTPSGHTLDDLHYELFDLPTENPPAPTVSPKPPPFSEEVEHSWQQFIKRQAAANAVPDGFTP